MAQLCRYFVSYSYPAGFGNGEITLPAPWGAGSARIVEQYLAQNGFENAIVLYYAPL